MCDKDMNETSPKETVVSCGCGQMESGRGCPCKKRICLPILGLAALAIVASMVAKRKGRK